MKPFTPFAPDATTIAEEMSGFPGLSASTKDGGLGFDYRLQMGAPDLWIKTLKEKNDEDWDLGQLAYTLSSHRPEEKSLIMPKVMIKRSSAIKR